MDSTLCTSASVSAEQSYVSVALAGSLAVIFRRMSQGLRGDVSDESSRGALPLRVYVPHWLLGGDSEALYTLPCPVYTIHHISTPLKGAHGSRHIA